MASPEPAHQDNPAEVFKDGSRFESEDYKYQFEELIGDGGYGKVYEAKATPKKAKQGQRHPMKVAVKIVMECSLSIEAKVLLKARSMECKRIPLIYDQVSSFVLSLHFSTYPFNHFSDFLQGRVNNRAIFISMELKGRDLYQLRKERSDRKFSLGTAVRAGIQTLEVSAIF